MRRTKKRKKYVKVSDMELIQIGTPQSKPMVSIREMFEQMAQREAEMVRLARERMRIDSSPRSNKQ